jgi:prepilin-type N-terminal cleavage/methylation domain-containing protein
MNGGRFFSMGFSLLEVLIALMIIAGVLFGVVSLQSLAMRQVHAVDAQLVAVLQAEGLFERFRANHSSAGFAREFSWVQQQIPFFLPQGRCEYQCSGFACTVSVFWEEHGLQSFTLSSLL